MKEMVKECKYGLMVADTKVTGRKTRPMGEGDSFMQMEMCMRVIG